MCAKQCEPHCPRRSLLGLCKSCLHVSMVYTWSSTVNCSLLWSDKLSTYGQYTKHGYHEPMSRCIFYTRMYINGFIILSYYGLLARIYIWSSIFLALGNTIYIYLSRTLQSFTHLLMASYDLSFHWTIPRTGIYLLGHGSRLYILMDCNLLVSDREG